MFFQSLHLRGHAGLCIVQAGRGASEVSLAGYGEKCSYLDKIEQSATPMAAI
jgi:hypothetical protein